MRATAFEQEVPLSCDTPTSVANKKYGCVLAGHKFVSPTLYVYVTRETYRAAVAGKDDGLPAPSSLPSSNP